MSTIASRPHPSETIDPDRSLVIDNFDSFTWNLVDQLRRCGDDPVVLRSDDLPNDAPLPRRLLISPGPGRPEDAITSHEWIRRCMGQRPILGVCLGHQCIASLFKARVLRAPTVRHGRAFPLEHDGKGLFANLPSKTSVMRYHSLVVDASTLPAEIEASAWCEDSGHRILMGLRHRDLPLEGLQFHPESFLSPDGDAILRSFLACPMP